MWKKLRAALVTFVGGMFISVALGMLVGAVTGAGMGSCGFYGSDIGVDLEILLLVGGPLLSIVAAIVVAIRVGRSRPSSAPDG